MNKQEFIAAIEAIQKQYEHDIQFAEHLAKAFPDAFKASLMPKNEIVVDALIKVLQTEMNDTETCKYGQTWIYYFIWELDFGRENYRLEVTENGKNVPMSNAGELWEYLNKNKNKQS